MTRGKLLDTQDKLRESRGDVVDYKRPSGSDEFNARVVRARMPKRSAPTAGAPTAPTRAVSGEPSGPGPAFIPERGTHGARERAALAAERPTWRERTSEYILAGGAVGGVGGKRRGPHERGVLRDGLVGWAGQAHLPVQGPNDMFPHGSFNVGSASGDGASSVSSASRGRSRSSVRKPQRKGMSLGFDDVEEEEEEEDPLAGLEGLEDPTEVGKKKKRFFGLF